MSKRKWELKDTTTISTDDDVAKISALYSEKAQTKVKDALKTNHLEMSEDVSLVVQQATWEAMQDLCNGNMAAQQIRDRLLGLGFIHMPHQKKWRFYDKAMQICIAAKSLGKYESLEDMVVPFRPKVIKSEADKLQWEESTTPQDLIENWNQLIKWNIKKTEPMKTYVVETEKEYKKAMTDFTKNNAITDYCDQQSIPVDFKSTRDLWSQFYKTVYRVWVVLGSNCSQTQMFQNVTSLFKDALHDTKDCQSLVEQCVHAKGIFLRMKLLGQEKLVPVKGSIVRYNYPKNADAAKKKLLAFMKWADSDALSKYLEDHGGLNVRSIDDMPLGWLLKCFQSWNLTEEHQSILRLLKDEEDEYPNAAAWCLSFLDVWKEVNTREAIINAHYVVHLKKGNCKCLSCKEPLQYSPQPIKCAFHPLPESKKSRMPPWIHNRPSCRARIEKQGDAACCKECCRSKNYLLCEGCNVHIKVKEGTEDTLKIECNPCKKLMWHKDCAVNLHAQSGEEWNCKSCFVTADYTKCCGQGCAKWVPQKEIISCICCKKFHVHPDCSSPSFWAARMAQNGVFVCNSCYVGECSRCQKSLTTGQDHHCTRCSSDAPLCQEHEFCLSCDEELENNEVTECSSCHVKNRIPKIQCKRCSNSFFCSSCRPKVGFDVCSACSMLAPLNCKCCNATQSIESSHDFCDDCMDPGSQQYRISRLQDLSALHFLLAIENSNGLIPSSSKSKEGLPGEEQTAAYCTLLTNAMCGTSFSIFDDQEKINAFQSQWLKITQLQYQMLAVCLMTIVGKEPNDRIFGTIQNCLGTIYSARIELVVRRFVEMIPEKGTAQYRFLFEGHQQEN